MGKVSEQTSHLRIYTIYTVYVIMYMKGCLTSYSIRKFQIRTQLLEYLQCKTVITPIACMDEKQQKFSFIASVNVK